MVSVLAPSARRCGDVVPGRFQHARKVHAPVLFEVLVFGGENGVPQNFRNLAVSQQNAPLQRERSDGLPVVRVKLRHHVRPVILQRVNFRQVARIHKQQSHRRAQRNRAHHQKRKRQPAEHRAAGNLHRRAIESFHCPPFYRIPTDSPDLPRDVPNLSRLPWRNHTLYPPSLFLISHFFQLTYFLSHFLSRLFFSCSTTASSLSAFFCSASLPLSLCVCGTACCGAPPQILPRIPLLGQCAACHSVSPPYGAL